MQKGEPGEAVLPFADQLAGPFAAGGIVVGGEFEQAQAAAGPRADAEGDHPRPAVVARVEARMGAEGLAGAQGPVEGGEAPGLEADGVELVGAGGFPEGQQAFAQPHHMGVGDVLEPHIKGVGQGAPGFLGAEHTAVEKPAGLFFGLPALGAHEAVAEAGSPIPVEPQGADHAVAVERVMHPLAAPLEPAGTIAVEGAHQAGGQLAAAWPQGHVTQFLADVAEAAAPVGPVVATGVGTAGGDGHGSRGQIPLPIMTLQTVT